MDLLQVIMLGFKQTALLHFYPNYPTISTYSLQRLELDTRKKTSVTLIDFKSLK